MGARYAVTVALGLAMSGCGASQGDSPVIYSAGPEITIRVPDMHCQKGCYPVVKETLEQQAGVESVKLYPQTKPAEIDDRRVRVTLNGSFDTDKALAALAADNFPGATVEGVGDSQ